MRCSQWHFLIHSLLVLSTVSCAELDNDATDPTFDVLLSLESDVMLCEYADPQPDQWYSTSLELFHDAILGRVPVAGQQLDARIVFDTKEGQILTVDGSSQGAPLCIECFVQELPSSGPFYVDAPIFLANADQSYELYVYGASSWDCEEENISETKIGQANMEVGVSAVFIEGIFRAADYFQVVERAHAQVAATTLHEICHQLDLFHCADYRCPVCPGGNVLLGRAGLDDLRFCNMHLLQIYDGVSYARTHNPY